MKQLLSLRQFPRAPQRHHHTALPSQGAMKQLLSLRQFSAWVTPASGCMLVAGGTYTLLSRLVPA